MSLTFVLQKGLRKAVFKDAWEPGLQNKEGFTGGRGDYLRLGKKICFSLQPKYRHPVAQPSLSHPI